MAAQHYQIYFCPRCKYRVWDKEGKRVGWCKASGKPVPLVEKDDLLTASDPSPCIWFERDKKRR